MAKKFNSPDQLEFDRSKLHQKQFTLQSLVQAKLNKLADKIDLLSHSDVVWLSRVEDFFFKTEYLTERQTQILDSIYKRQLSSTNGACIN